MLFNYSCIKFNLLRLTGPGWDSADAYNTVLKIQTAYISLTANLGETSPFEISHLLF